MRSVLLGALVLIAGLSGVARAEDAARAAASAAYSRGVELANQGQYEGALEQFESAYTRSPHYAVLYNIGQAQIALGRPLQAIAALSKYLRDGEEQVPLSRREQVQAQIALLESRLAELTVATDTPGATLLIDGHEVGTAPLFQPIRLAAGSHTVTARLPSGAEVVQAVVLGEAERQKLELALAGATPPPPAPAPRTPVAAPQAPAAALPAAPPPPPAATPPADELPHPRGPALRHAAYVLAGAGVVAGAAALTIYLAYRGKYQDWQAGSARLATLTPGTIAYYQQADANNARASSLTTANDTILGLSLAGGAAAATGAVLFLVDRHARHAASLTVGWNDGGATVGWSGAW